jgi:hypothetical protein
VAFLTFLLAGFFTNPFIIIPAVIVLFIAIQMLTRKYGLVSEAP